MTTSPAAWRTRTASGTVLLKRLSPLMARILSPTRRVPVLERGGGGREERERGERERERERERHIERGKCN